MHKDEVKQRQAPLKEKYRSDPDAARVQFESRGSLDPESLICRVDSVRGEVVSGLHPAAGGEIGSACSGDMMLDALVACAGVTLNAVATAMGIELRGGSIRAIADMDFRGTLAVDRETPVGIQNVTLTFDLDTDAEAAQQDKLIELAERYCVILQTLKHPPDISARRV